MTLKQVGSPDQKYMSFSLLFFIKKERKDNLPCRLLPFLHMLYDHYPCHILLKSMKL